MRALGHPSISLVSLWRFLTLFGPLWTLFSFRSFSFVFLVDPGISVGVLVGSPLRCSVDFSLGRALNDSLKFP